MIKQLAFPFFEPNPKLIVLGRDPEQSGRWLVRCQVCQKVRSLGAAGKNKAIRMGRSTCLQCVRKSIPSPNRKHLANTDTCVIIEQYFEKRGGRWKSLVICPDCRKQFTKACCKISRNEHTFCKTCAIRRTRGKPLPSSAISIVLQPYLKQISRDPKAQVQCPYCKTTFSKSRSSIRKQQHTICPKCANSTRHRSWQSGPEHPNWSGEISNTDKLITLGKSAQSNKLWLLQCPTCQEIRSVSYHGKRVAVRKGSSFCHPCAAREAGRNKRGISISKLGKRQLILPESSNCIILNSWIKTKKNGTSMALVKCPDCNKEFFKARTKIFENKHTVCKTCGNRRTFGKLIESHENCIVLEQFTTSPNPPIAAALVQCPDCKRTFVKFRNSIILYNHTVCFDCSITRRFGETRCNEFGDNWLKIRSDIRARDNHACQFPGCVETSLTQGVAVSAHHITPRRMFEKVNDSNTSSNLISLCMSHHGWADRHLNESIPLLQSVLKERLNPASEVEHNIVRKRAQVS